MDGLTNGQVTTIAAWGLVIGTAFFSFCALRDDRDFFLMMGLLCCTIGNIIFAFYLYEQNPTGGGGANETMVALYGMLAALSVYALGHQWNMYRLYGFNEDSDDEDSDSDDETGPAPAGKPAGPTRTPGALPAPAAAAGKAKKDKEKETLSAEEQQERAALRPWARAAIAAAKEASAAGSQ